ncbi:hypothetical protein DDD_2810 [Nonlabens dokdonensis DSW-6]|uniref:Uncharacterized protein n=1 Tax=Nonlabens dokdonensis (strain DSM 17205 / KCTC 12402 / DSW-6) TaxID=592029 RepID=L7WCI2_NONDD|nr:hypothetical protein DDD_2810 [Nonlabens dokdonensis DSW-6]
MVKEKIDYDRVEATSNFDLKFEVVYGFRAYESIRMSQNRFCSSYSAFLYDS